MRRNLLLVTGVSGCGKDFLLGQARQYDTRIGRELPVVGMGDAIVVEWRDCDHTRRREVETVDDIAYHQDFTIQTAQRMAALLGANCALIENVPGNYGNASLALATMVKEVCPE